MKKIKITATLPLLLTLVFSACTNSLKISKNNILEQKAQKHTLSAINHVNIIPMTKGNKLIENATVVIKDKKILSINKSIPKDAQIINGEFRFFCS